MTIKSGEIYIIKTVNGHFNITANTKEGMDGKK